MNMTRSTMLIVLIMMVVLVAAGAAVWLVKERQAAVSLEQSNAGVALGVRDAAPYTDLTGQELALSDNVGQVMVVHSWASWCVQCGADLATLEAVATTFTADEVVVLAINRGEPASTAQRYLARIIGSDSAVELILDPDDSFYKSINGYAMPETVIFDQTGAEVARYRTELRAEDLENKLRELLR